MRVTPILGLLTTLVILGGCSPDPDTPAPDLPLVGNWQADVEEMTATAEFARETEFTQQTIVSMLTRMEIVVTEHSMTMNLGGGISNTTPYRVLSRDGNTLTIESTSSEGKTVSAEFTVEGDRLVFSNQGKDFHFRRKTTP